MQIKILTQKNEMLAQIDVLNHLYPSLTLEALSNDLDIMLSNNYQQAIVLENDECIGLSGFWINKKLWCSKYLEIDNLVVKAEHRSKGVGQFLLDFFDELAAKENCSIITLDSYRENTRAHQLFEQNNFQPKGIHFVKFLDKSAIR